MEIVTHKGYNHWWSYFCEVIWVKDLISDSTLHLSPRQRSQIQDGRPYNLNIGGNVKIEFRYKKAKMMFNATFWGYFEEKEFIADAYLHISP